MPTDHILDRPDDWTQTFWGNVGVQFANLLPYAPVQGEGPKRIVPWFILIRGAINGFELGCALSLHDPSLGKSVLERDCTVISPYQGEVSENWESVYEPIIQDLHRRISACGNEGPSYRNMFPESGPDLTQTAASKVIARQAFRGLILPFISEEVAEQILISGIEEPEPLASSWYLDMPWMKSMPIPELLTLVKQHAASVYKEWTEFPGTDSSETNAVGVAQTPFTINLDFDSLYKLGTAFLDQDEFGKARACFDEALLLKPDEPDTLFLRAVALEGLEDPALLDKALADCTQAIDIRPDYYNYLWVRARLLLALSRYGESLADVDRAMELAPGKFDPYTLDQFYFFAATASMIMVADLRREALEFLKRAIACEPEKYRDLASQEDDFYLLSVDPQYGAQFRELVSTR